jgi:citrate lyase beta subunit
MGPRRVLLTIPGNILCKIRKSTPHGIDSVFMDVEDGNAANGKTEAHAAMIHTLINHQSLAI